MKRIWLVMMGLFWLAACSGGGGGATVNPPDNTNGNSASADGYVFGASRQLATQQAPLAGAAVQAIVLSAGSSSIATAQANTRGRFSFSPSSSNGVPPGKTIQLRASGGTRVVSGLVNTVAGIVSKNLTEVTHLAALAAVRSGQTTLTDAQIEQYETVARAKLEAALLVNAAADFTAVDQQTTAGTLADSIAADLASAPSNHVPTLANVVVAPAQMDHRGGTVNVTALVTDADADPVAVSVLVYAPGATTPQVVALTAAGGNVSGSFDVVANTTTSTQIHTVALVADDGAAAPTPQTVRTVSVLPDGEITLDILVETLFDEPASRATADQLADRWRALAPRLMRGGSTRTRQVNDNQTIRGADIVFEDQPSLTGNVGDDGLLLLNVPLSAADDGAMAVTASISGRVPYTQYLVLPEGVTLLAGDRIEADLVLAKAADWQQLAGLYGLGTLDFATVPLFSFFSVQSNLSLTGATPGATALRPITSSARSDDYDYFAANLPVGTVTVSGSHAVIDNVAKSYPFGPVDLTLAVGHVGSGAALIPPSASRR